MVKICSLIYPIEKEEIYQNYYKQFNFQLHSFQKWAIESILTGNHTLITAPTGTGKTLPAEFAIQYFNSIGKKLIYTCPIKALSNEKYFDFTRKFPNIQIGLITGDISCNPNADILIMTLEILMNKLYQINSQINTNKNTSFEIDIQNELGCVVFDEIHFINDEKRGTNWEQTIMMLPSHIQIIGLSATLDQPENFAEWIENTLNSSVVNSSVVNSSVVNSSVVNSSVVNSSVEKEVYLCKKNIRSVPLIHYSFIATTSAVNKIIKDKTLQQEIKQCTNVPIVIQDEKGLFNEMNYQKIHKTLTLFEKNEIQIKRRHVINKLSEYLVENEMLPALCYVFSRKQVEKCAEELNTNLLEFDSKVPYTVDYECEQILRKLSNYQEYLHLPEYLKIVELFRKGIGMHHAGMIPILREMTEIMFSKGYIKILFCTETMSIGINLPVKTTIFTDIYKFNGEISRILYSHEYTQAAGRAGRLGLDVVGHVIHLSSLFKNIDSLSLKNMMKGIPQKLVSKFNISYNLILNLIKTSSNLINFVEQSMSKNDVIGYINEYKQINNDLQSKLSVYANNLPYRNSIDTICEYIDLNDRKNSLVNKKRKECEKKIKNIFESNKFIDDDVKLYLQKHNIENQIIFNETSIKKYENFYKDKIDIVLNQLTKYGMIEKNSIIETNNYYLTSRGEIASNLREVHCLFFCNILFDSNNLFHTFYSEEIAGLLSCFTSISIPIEKRDVSPNIENNDELLKYATFFFNNYNEYKEHDLQNNINSDMEEEIHFDLIQYIINWCNCHNENECKQLLQTIYIEKNISCGEFIKCILKINNIVEELKICCEIIGLINLNSKLCEISGLTLKYIATNQSLYV